jgi:hypothetical protein
MMESQRPVIRFGCCTIDFLNMDSNRRLLASIAAVNRDSLDKLSAEIGAACGDAPAVEVVAAMMMLLKVALDDLKLPIGENPTVNRAVLPFARRIQ